MIIFIDCLVINRLQDVQPQQPLVNIPYRDIKVTYAAKIKPTQQISERVVTQLKQARHCRF